MNDIVDVSRNRKAHKLIFDCKHFKERFLLQSKLKKKVPFDGRIYIAFALLDSE